MPKKPRKLSQEETRSFQDPQDMLMNAPIGVFLSTPEGRIISANQTLADMFGYDSADDLTGSITSIAEQIYADPQDREELLRLLKLHGQAVNYEKMMLRRDKTVIWTSINARAVRREDGEVIHYQGFISDITKRKMAESNLRKKSEELELYFSSSLDLLCIANTSGLFIRLNPEWERVLGYSVAELEGRSFLDFVHPEDMESTLEALSMLKKQEEILNFANRYLCKDGTCRWIEWRSRPLGQLIYAAARDITERKQDELKLKESEESLARTLQSIGDGVISTDHEGRVIRMNPVAEKLCAWKESEARGRYLSDVFRIVNALTGEPVQDPVKMVFKTGQIVGLGNHTQLLSRDGSQYQIADSASPIHDPQGIITGAVLVFRDVTQEYARDKLIKDERKQLLSIFNSIDAMIYICDPDTYEILYVNSKLAELLPENCIGSRCYETFQGLSEPCAFCTNSIILKHKPQPYQWEYYNPSLDRHFSIVDRIIQWTDGRDVRFEMAMDITERKEMEEALRLSEKDFRQLFQQSPLSAMLFDMDSGEIVDVNAAGLHSYGCSTLKELKDHDFWSEPPYSQADVLEWNRKAAEEGPQQFQWLSRKITGEHFWEQVFLRPLDIRGKQRIMAVSVDITARKRLEEEREKLQVQLLQAQKMESIGILAGGVAHDFNNMLQALGGHIEFLMQGKADDHSDMVRLKSMSLAIDRAAQLVQQLLLFSRKAEPKKVRVSLNQEVKEAARILERTIPKMISLELSLETSLWSLEADPVQIQQVLLNLVHNSIDAMPDGGKIWIKTDNTVLDHEFVRIHPGSTTGPHVLLTAADTGCGLEEALLKHIFDPFFTTKEVGKGTGLGLATVYGIVKAHGGYVQCLSKPGKGMTVHIYLPALHQTEPETVNTRREIISCAGTGRETILVVDDEPEIRELTREALEEVGYTILSAASGEEALIIYRKHGPAIDLILLDLGMPGMGGHKCLLKLLDLNPSIKVIIASGYAAHDQGSQALSSGAMDFISKPFRFQDLTKTVRRVLDMNSPKADLHFKS